MESKDSSTKKLKDYQQRIDELERIVGQKQLKIDYLQKLFELAESDLGFDLKKISGHYPQMVSRNKSKDEVFTKSALSCCWNLEARISSDYKKTSSI